MKKNKERVLGYLGNVGMAIITVSLMRSPASAIDPVEAANLSVGSEGGKEAAKRALEGALKVAKGKPALTTSTGILCLACVPVAGAAASPGLCIACGILIAKTFG